MRIIVLTFIVIIGLCSVTKAQDLNGQPLPEFCINQETHDRVLEATGLTTNDYPPNDHAYWHWLASCYTIELQAAEIQRLGGELFQCQNPVVTLCDIQESWSGGDLWKPDSDNTGRPVFLIGDEFGSSRQCEVFDGGTKILDCRFRTCCPNGNRAHFDVPTDCENLPDNIIVRVVLNGVRYCWTVPSACQRFE